MAARRSAANATAARRSPRLLPTAIRPDAGAGAGLGRLANRLSHPPRGKHGALGAGAVGPPAEEVGAAGQRLLEDPLMLECFAEDHVQHGPVSGVRQ